MVIIKRGVIALVISVLCAPTQAGAVPRFPSIIDLQGASELRLGDSTGVPRGYYDLCRASHFVCRLSSNGSGVSLTKFGKVILSTDAADLLAKTNLAVNRGMREQTDAQRHGVKDRWTVGGAAGDCEDFALTKKAKLIKAGWPSSALLWPCCSGSSNRSRDAGVAMARPPPRPWSRHYKAAERRADRAGRGRWPTPRDRPNEVAGRVGHTGNSTASPPFQLMDAADSPAAQRASLCIRGVSGAARRRLAAGPG